MTTERMPVEKVILHCIIYYNSQRVIENFPYTEEMISADIKPYASEIWNYSKHQMGANLISTDPTALILTLLPRTIGRFKRDGLWVNKLRYSCNGFTEQYLNGGTCTAAYNPEDVTSVWLVDAGCYTEFTLIDSRYQHKNLTEVQETQSCQRMIIKGTERDTRQSTQQYMEDFCSCLPLS